MVGLKKRKPEWLSSLLHSKFFDSCIDHQELRKNEKNMFCIDCNLCFCKHCITSSTHCNLHRCLQICKYVYHDVVRLQDIQKYLDSSQIQTYKINGEKAVHLNPRPQLKEFARNSKPKAGTSCEACGRHIQDLPNRFCSIACKVTSDTGIIFTKIDELSSENDSSQVFETWVSKALLRQRRILHKRKGIPIRAPLR
ncbi:PLATZ transcription factor family protein [Abeliophyllum distichum]|uniref:PLATZ transcription factor family protein n=1 Tax=Abeliophyllum distichum TaxID=126358 RepID=A0ABD1U1S8_9LAMI